MREIADRSYKRALLTLVLMLLVMSESASGQTTAFSYQGRLTDAGNPADGLFDMQFKLFNTQDVGTGTQQGPTVTNTTVQITRGVFNIMLDFGNLFDGSARFLEISLRPTGSPAPRTTLSPRQPITSAPYALHSQTAANAMQLSGMNPTSFVQFNPSGNVGIGTSNPVAKLGVASSTASAGNNTAYFEAPAIGPNASNIHFGTTGDWYIRSAHSSGKVILQDTGGDVGIGTANPQSPLTVFAFSPSHGITHTDGAVTVGTYIDAQGGWLGTRSNHLLHFFTNNSSPKMTLDTGGNLGIGTTNPTRRLMVEGTGFVETKIKSTNERAILSLDSTISGANRVWTLESGLFGFPGLFGIYDLTAGQGRLMIDTAGNVGIGTATPNAKLQVAGNVTQPRENGGFAKAMIYVNSDGGILRCYNGVTGSSSGNCGFSINHFANGGYGINFGFQVSDRFVSVSTQGVGTVNRGVNFSISGTSSIDVRTFLTSEFGGTEDNVFMIIVY